MIFAEIIYTILKVAGLLVLLLLGRAIYLYIGQLATIKRLTDQGIESYPGNSMFLIEPGMTQRGEYMRRARDEVQPSYLIYLMAILDEKIRGPSEPKFNAEKHPMVTVRLFSKFMTFIADPDVVQDIYTAKGKYLDKHPFTQEMFKDLFDGFAFMPMNETYKI